MGDYQISLKCTEDLQTTEPRKGAETGENRVDKCAAETDTGFTFAVGMSSGKFVSSPWSSRNRTESLC
jgi:hypothetical protein